jgi:hypothetical protein
MHYFLLSPVPIWLDLSAQNVRNESDFRKSQKEKKKNEKEKEKRKKEIIELGDLAPIMKIQLSKSQL